ncbi:MAG: nucleoid-associated protein [Bacteroidota bacterium]
MINFANIELEEIAIHRVGNKHRAERNFISSELYELDEAMREILLHYFTKPLKRTDDLCHFSHGEDLNLNEVYSFVRSIFIDRNTLLNESVNIVEHLYRQSTHPNIKSGEVYVAYFSGLVIDDEVVDAVGIFKTEQKNTFFKVAAGEQKLVLRKEKGVNVEKLDKGCLVLNTDAEEGYRVISVDNNNYDANYWPYNFLNIDFVRNESFHTKNYLALCNGFSEEIIAPATDKRQQIKFLTDSVDYFTSNEVFDLEDFTKTVLPEEETAREFRAYHETYAPENSNGFNISQKATKSATKHFKNTIKLDTGIQIKLDFYNPESSRQFIERVYDEERGMYCYKIFFNEEIP